MFWLLMRTRLLSARNVIKETWRNNSVLAAAMSLAGVCLFLGMFLGFMLLFHFAAQYGVLEETIYQAFYYFFLLLLAGAVPFVASTLLQSADYSLLFAAPIPPRTVVAAKLLDATITNSLQFTVLGIPALVACAVSLNFPMLEWVILFLLIVLFMLLPALLTAFALLVALAVVGMSRLRAAITLINVLMGIGVCITFVLEARNLPFKFSGANGEMSQFHPVLHSVSTTAHLLPSAWFAGVIVELAQAKPAANHHAMLLFGMIVIVCGTLFAACMTLGGRLLSSSSVVADSEGHGTLKTTGRDDARHWRRLLGAPLAGIFVKDLKYVWRDNMLLSQMSVPLILFLVPYLIGLQNRSMDARTELFPFSAVIVLFIIFIQTSILSLSLLGMEAEGFWMVLSAPASRRALLWAKWLLSTLMTGGLSLLLCVIAALSFRADLLWVLAESVIVIICTAGLCGIGVGISAMFPRFIHENPAMRVTPLALILSFFVTAIYMALTLLIFIAAWLVGAGQNTNSAPPVTFAIAFGSHLLLTIIVVVVSMEIGIHRLIEFEWNH